MMSPHFRGGGVEGAFFFQKKGGEKATSFCDGETALERG